MSYIDDLNQAASEALAASSSATDSAQIMSDVANGDENTTVTTANGEVKTLAKAIKDIIDSIEAGVEAPQVEPQTLSAGQTTVSLTTMTTEGIAVYVEGSREFDFTVVNSTDFDFSQSFPDGTRIWVVKRDIEGTADNFTVNTSTGTQTLVNALEDRGAVFESVADLKSAVNLQVGQHVRTLGYNTPGDSGGNDYEIVAAGTGADDGGSFIDLAGSGLQARGLFCGDVNVRQFGAACDGSDESSAARASLAYADSIGIGHVRLDSENLYAPGLLHSDYPNIRLVGSGKITGAYRRRCFAQTEGKKSNVRPINFKNATALRSASTPNVVLVGDSISTYWANVRTRGGVFSTSVEMEFRNQFGDIEFYNRAIGGTTYSQLDSTPDTYPEWYTDTGKPWLDYISEISPDCIVLAFGMNDSGNFKSSAFLSVMAKINAFAKVPTVILCTPLTPSLDGKDGFGGDSVDAQEGRDYAAGFLRTYALRNAYPLWDFNRLHNMVRDGFDAYLGAIGEREAGITPVATPGAQMSILGSRQVYNYAAELDLDESAFTSTEYINFYFGEVGANYVQIRNSGGFYRFTGRYGSDDNNILFDVTTSESVGASVKTIYMEKYGNIFTAYRRDVDNGSATPAIITERVIATGGLYTPKIATKDTATILQSGVMYYDQPTLIEPEITDFDLWGGDDASFGEYGGSGLNHPGTKAATFIYEPIISATNLAG